MFNCVVTLSGINRKLLSTALLGDWIFFLGDNALHSRVHKCATESGDNVYQVSVVYRAAARSALDADCVGYAVLTRGCKFYAMDFGLTIE